MSNPTERLTGDGLAHAHDGSVDVRGETDASVRAGTYAFEADDLTTGWHKHDLNQIEYALRGVVEVETANGRFLLPPQQAIWIPAGTFHRTIFKNTRTVAAFFDPSLIPASHEGVRILSVTPVVREMIIYASRWPINRVVNDKKADIFMLTLGTLIVDALEHELPLRLPMSDDPLIQTAMDYTRSHLRDATPRTVAQAVGVSERTLRRQFFVATGTTWRQYLLQSRILHAMGLLSDQKKTVLEIATSVGFDSVSAFIRSFGRYTGETPSGYRRRVGQLSSAA